MDQAPAIMDGSFSCKDEDTNSSSSSGGGGSGSGGRSSFLSDKEEPACFPPEYYAVAPAATSLLRAGPTRDTKLNPASTVPARATAAASSSSSPKRSGRRSVHKRVVSVPIAEADASRTKGSGECAPPSDSWAWRKYGQKPIKGSPYPRGYYRCSSSKGCPARKQVERSRMDPTMLVVTYACEHNHPWPLPKNHHHSNQQQQTAHQQPSTAARSPPKPAPHEQEPDTPILPGPALTSSPGSADHEDSFATDLLVDDASLAMMTDEFGWFSDVSASPPAAEALLCGGIGGADDAAMMLDDDAGGDGTPGDEESSLFAGLGELPECAVVFRRGFLERQLRMQMEVEDERRRVAAAPCCGTTG